VLLFGILNGVMVAVVVSMLLLIRRAAHPHVAFLGRIPGTRSYSDIERHPDNEAVPGALLFRVEASLPTSPSVDLAAARMLAMLHATLEAMGMRLRLVAAHAAMRDILRAEGLEERVGYFDRRGSVADVIDELQGGTEAGGPAAQITPAK